MSFVVTHPESLHAAANSLQTIGTTVGSANAAAATPTSGLAPAASDEVSALTAAQFAMHGQLYQQISAQAQAIHEQFVAMLASGGAAYAATEAANAAAAG